LRAWPFVASLSFGLVPVVLFGAMAAMLVVNSLPALDNPGLDQLTRNEFASQFSTGERIFGLVPAVVGTLLVVVIAIAIALPVSLAMAVLATEFTLGPIGKGMRTVLGVLGGIPPIVYALLAIVLVERFMIPKFAGGLTFPTFDAAKIGSSADKWPPSDVPFNAGAYPWDPTGLSNSTLLGGILIALLIIPFMAPLMADAIGNVPRSAREASLAVGATRWFTLRKVTLPLAAPGLLGALSLGVLKAMGDAMIVIFVIGWDAQRVPTPLFDVLERTAPLTAESAALLGGFQGQSGNCQAASCHVGYFSALLLFLAAIVIVLATTVLQARLRKRIAAL
jgi:phosphate transport system permease protein